MRRQPVQKSLLAMLLIGQLGGAAPAEPAPEWAQDAVDTLQQRGIIKGYPDGSVEGSRATSRNELAELLERFDQRRLQEESQFAPRSDLDALRQEAQSTLDDTNNVGTRVDNLEQNTDQIQQRRDEVRRPGL